MKIVFPQIVHFVDSIVKDKFVKRLRDSRDSIVKEKFVKRLRDSQDSIVKEKIREKAP
jgi:hypothetical protein